VHLRSKHVSAQRLRAAPARSATRAHGPPPRVVACRSCVCRRGRQRRRRRARGRRRRRARVKRCPARACLVLLPQAHGAHHEARLVRMRHRRQRARRLQLVNGHRAWRGAPRRLAHAHASAAAAWASQTRGRVRMRCRGWQLGYGWRWEWGLSGSDDEVLISTMRLRCAMRTIAHHQRRSAAHAEAQRQQRVYV
jgi:hypothetical protein